MYNLSSFLTNTIPVDSLVDCEYLTNILETYVIIILL